MRFNVGEKSFFASIKYVSKKTQKTMCSYTFYGDLIEADIVDLDIIQLECKSHHKVPVEYSDSLADGFIFADANGTDYYNQYPFASYGQMSDTGDRVVYLKDELITKEMISDKIPYSFLKLESIIEATQDENLQEYKNMQILKKLLKEKMDALNIDFKMEPIFKKAPNIKHAVIIQKETA